MGGAEGGRMTASEERRRPPLTEAAFYILLSLASGPKHGYAILKEVEALSQGRILFSTGTLYGGLKRFLEWGWIRRARAEDGPPSDRPRKAYELSGVGRRVLDAEVARLQGLVKTARLRTAQGRR
jgi:PadR family transcriptional regulator PadR